MDKPVGWSIAAVERDTGLSKDTLRVWERRYGFPTPERDAIGERAYPQVQVEKLRLVKQLLDAGHRPGRIVQLPIDELARLTRRTSAAAACSGAEAGSIPELRTCLDLLHVHDIEGLRRRLTQARLRLGLGRFVNEVVATLNTRVGEAWMRGQLQVFQEHLYAEVMQSVLREAIHGLPQAAPLDRPRLLLTTLPGEPHGLGLLMAEAVLAIGGARCLSMGVQTPLWDIVLAARACHSDIVALSFTGCMPPGQVVRSLTELRERLPEAVELWVGGSAPVLHRRRVVGVTPIEELLQIEPEVERWRLASCSGRAARR